MSSEQSFNRDFSADFPGSASGGGNSNAAWVALIPLTAVDFYLDWNGDFLLTPSGSIQTSIGWDRIRQRIIRRAITNPAQRLPSGRSTPADYVFHKDFGLGMGSLVDNPFSDGLIQALERRIVAACLQDADIDVTSPPQVKFYRPNPSLLWIVVGVKLVNGQPGEIALQYGTPSH